MSESQLGNLNPIFQLQIESKVVWMSLYECFNPNTFLWG